ncbi:lysis system i-spanin subunit Rz [Pseudomonas fluorescens]|nr:lysis system i-spanin subunit Rz [Pseudomonas fluorescens]MBT0622687.1 lysis system i-spanin subunit Rz [Pseudomonas fluorescens]
MAWQVQAWRYAAQIERQASQQSDALNQLTQAALRQHRTEQDKRLATEQQLAAADQLHSRELADEQREQARLRDRLATADVRLSVLLAVTDSASDCDVPTAPGAVGVVHAARRVQLDPAHAQRIIGITDAGDQGLIALRACQAYAKEISTPK